MKVSLLGCVSLASMLMSSVNAAIVTIQVGNPTQPGAKRNQYSPQVTKVNVGDTVKFLFNGEHSVTTQATANACTPGAAPGAKPFDSKVMGKGQEFVVPATSLVAGSTIMYYCTVGAHCKADFMQGAIVVSAAGGSKTPTVPGTKTPTVAGTKTPTAPGTKTTTTPGAAGTGGATAAAGGKTAAKTIAVMVGQGGNTFTPGTVSASPGDTVKFTWVAGSHNVVPSDAAGSCIKSKKAATDPTMKLLASGAPQTSGQHLFVVPKTATAGSKIPYFCSVATHCSAGKMFGTINIVAPGAAGAAVAPGATPAATPGGGASADPAGGNSTDPAAAAAPPPASQASSFAGFSSVAMVASLAIVSAALLV